MRKRIFFIPGRQVGVFSGYGACSSPTLPLVNIDGGRYKFVRGSTFPTTQIFLEILLSHSGASVQEISQAAGLDGNRRTAVLLTQASVAAFSVEHVSFGSALSLHI